MGDIKQATVAVNVCLLLPTVVSPAAWQQSIVLSCLAIVEIILSYQYYASVGGAPEAYGSHRVCVRLFLFLCDS